MRSWRRRIRIHEFVEDIRGDLIVGGEWMGVCFECDGCVRVTHAGRDGGDVYIMGDQDGGVSMAQIMEGDRGVTETVCKAPEPLGGCVFVHLPAERAVDDQIEIMIPGGSAKIFSFN